MAKARTVTGLTPDTRFGNAASAAVRVRAAEVFGFADRALDVADIEGVHDMRVATRRLRAALEVFALCFPREEHAALLHEVKHLADVLGARRDPDVAIAALRTIADALTPAEAPGIEGVVAELRAEQEAANVALAVELEDIRQSGLEGRLELLAAMAHTEPVTR